ncbi:MFS transporter [Planctomonas sp. JC2975]|uniref:MFS transporter n=1 Tax=Planctomonas sp. JC2975 TaxID=2729626 RepID=UPI001474AC0A|nr:MFS transporter [Planctomonas sp. JC2975]NNC13654.1 MFS transporter [Planctomonas sp. JC2975]
MTETPTHPGARSSAVRSGGRAFGVSRTAGFVAMSASLLAFFVAAGAPTPLLPIYEAEWHFAPSVLTIAFGVYAFAMIAALLVAGSLSDYIGRRPVLIGALALELAAMAVFLFAGDIAWIVFGRVLQGIATGVAASTFGAAIVELAPGARKKLGAVMSSLATTAGLGIGALFSGLVALAIPAAAATTVWVVLALVMAIGVTFAILTPETSTRRPGALRSLLPRVAVPVTVRRLFVATTPSIVAVFLETAFFLGLLPLILASRFEVSTPIIGGLLNFVMFTSATIAAAATSSIHPHRLKMWGNLGIAVGTLALLGALATGSMVLIWASAVIAGGGMGAVFSGSIRGLVPEVEPHQRAALFAAIFTVAYLTFGGSAILAGFIAAVTGLTAMAVGFGIVMGLSALVGIALSAGLLSRNRSASTHPTASDRVV